ncbi:MAG: hypothetical protein C4547_01585 [Phycisphaerales bacterium]|nr:MAG: hypothetical protein C4547_01585 [Phycisphaerales bacterium]
MTRPGHKKLTRYARWIVGLAAAAWVGRYVHFCLTAEPPGPDLSYWAPPGRPVEGDATQLLLAALDAIPTPPALTLPAPPAGRRWIPNDMSRFGLIVEDALTGSWMPASRPHLDAVIAYLESPATAAAISKLCDLTGRPTDARSGLADFNRFSQYRQAAKLLAAHARYALDQRVDADLSQRTFQAGLWLATAARGPWMIEQLVGTAMESLLLGELCQACLEHPDLPPPFAAELTRAIWGLPSLEAIWGATVTSEHRYQLAIVDCYYTTDERGDGLLLLGVKQSEELQGWFQVVDERNRLWNVTAFAFNGRRTATTKIDAYWQTVGTASQRPYADAVALLDAWGSGAYYGVVDGPLLESMDYNPRRSYELLVRLIAQRGAAVIMLALNQHNQRHEQYPASLDDLTPEFVDSLPVDPFCGRPYGYRLSDDGGYQLWSCGTDGIDDGGSAGRGSRGGFSGESGDDYYVKPRNEPVAEPESEPVSEGQ